MQPQIQTQKLNYPPQVNVQQNKTQNYINLPKEKIQQYNQQNIKPQAQAPIKPQNQEVQKTPIIERNKNQLQQKINSQEKIHQQNQTQPQINPAQAKVPGINQGQVQHHHQTNVQGLNPGHNHYQQNQQQTKLQGLIVD